MIETLTVPLGTRQRMLAMCTDIGGFYLERGDILRLLLVAALAEQNTLLLGPPGTAKSAVIRAIASHVSDAIYSELAMSKFTLIEDVAGPLKVSALRDRDAFERNALGTPCAAHIVFLDEVGRASGAVGDVLLPLINEHTFKGQAIPMRMCVSASNSPLSGTEREALDDRFLCRYLVDSIQQASNFDAYLAAMAQTNRRKYAPNPAHTFTLTEWSNACQDVAKVSLPASVRAELSKLRAKCSGAKIYVSDRRWGALVRVLQANAWLDGCSEIEADHLEILRHVLWLKPEDRVTVQAMIDTLDSGEIKWMADTADVVLREIVAWENLPDVGPANKGKAAPAIVESRLAAKQAIAAKLPNVSKRARDKGVRKLAEIDAAYKPVQEKLQRMMDL